MLECVNRLQDRVHAAVGEPQKFVRARALEPGEPLTQRRLRDREHLAVVEIVERLLRAAQGGVLDRLGMKRSGTEQR